MVTIRNCAMLSKNWRRGSRCHPFFYPLWVMVELILPRKKLMGETIMEARCERSHGGRGCRQLRLA